LDHTQPVRRELNGLEVMLGSYATGSGGVTLGGRRDRDLGPSGPGGQVGWALVVAVSKDYAFTSRTRILRGHEHSRVGWAAWCQGGAGRGSGAAAQGGE
jgi:hypothetical protein